ncbi:BFD-like [2Fe-2S] binding domain protein [Desulfosporosinus acididurans]|uniref:BFD-like [2Fe-2S] binding domain protein n=1 Tax=Desulfosporosinus acididurans TaxID=476652 RepID=A0A0J1FQH8_9FIRM|nr:BFD-like [2Fe-2S] binding domain protein [Desulfosporosinus acididurans]
MLIGLSNNSKVIPSCPVCGGIGQKVRQVTVEHQVKPDVEVEEEQLFLCRTSECEVAYYSEDGKKTILQDQLINKIWFKNVPPPVPICYCANVTEEEILHHVAVAQCCSTLEDIKRHTGANTGCECATKNPAGA